MLRNVGDKVVLRYERGYGSLNYLTLVSHGMVHGDEPVEIMKASDGTLNPNGSIPYDYQVKLPDGYLLDIDEKDINRILTEDVQHDG